MKIHGNEINSFFELLGHNENDITYATGWCLSEVKPFLNKFIIEIENKNINQQDFSIELQKFGEDKGYTDIELISEDYFYIIEAKKGWNLPSSEQLMKYISRFKKEKRKYNRIIVISDCRKEYAKRQLAKYNLKVPIVFISFNEIYKLFKEIKSDCNNQQRFILNELNKYYRKVIKMIDTDSNEVFCVVVSDKKIKGNFTFLNVVEKGYYFYPIKSGWPKDKPPTYIAFRYRGKLLSIHHVDGYEIVEKPDKQVPELIGWPGWSDNLHYMLKLGKGFKPDHEIKNGKIYATQHIKCMLDTLFTSKTIQEARDISQKRKDANI